MRKGMPEFLAIPLVVVLLGVVLVVLLVADAGAAVMVAFGVLATVAVVAVAVYAMRRPRGSLVGEAPEAFEGGAPPPEDGVHRVLLVADSACTTSDLEQLADGNTTVFVVVPAVSSRVARWTGDQQPYQDAEERLHATLQALGVLGLEGTGHVGSHDPLQAADEGLREFPAEEIVFALHPDSESEWLEQGVVDLGRGRYPVPVRELERRTDG